MPALSTSDVRLHLRRNDLRVGHDGRSDRKLVRRDNLVTRMTFLELLSRELSFAELARHYLFLAVQG